jgi:hypothetical protein
MRIAFSVTDSDRSDPHIPSILIFTPLPFDSATIAPSASFHHKNSESFWQEIESHFPGD